MLVGIVSAAGGSASLYAAAYLVAGVVAFFASNRILQAARTGARAPLVASAVVLCLLAVDRWFGLLDRVTNRGRNSARESGLYGSRRVWQVALLLALALIVLLVLLSLRRMGAATTASPLILVVSGLVVLRVSDALSLHQLDAVFDASLGGIEVDTVLEWALLAAALVAGSVAFVADPLRDGDGSDS